MKKLLLICLVFILGSAANVSAETIKKTVTTFSTNIRSSETIKKLEKRNSLLGSGILDVQVDAKTKDVRVTYNAKKTSDKTIILNFDKKLNVNAKVKGGNNNPEPAKNNVNTKTNTQRR